MNDLASPESPLWDVLGTILFLGMVGFVGFFVWLFLPKGKRRMPKSDAGIVPQYDPPEDITPAEFGMLYDYKGGRLEIIATLYALKLRKVLSLDRHDSGDINMELLIYDRTQLAGYEDLLIRYFFNKSQKVVLQAEASRPDFATLQAYFIYKLMQELQKKGYAFFETGFDTLSYDRYLENLSMNPLKLLTTLASQGAIGKQLTEKANALAPHIDGFAMYIKTAEIDKIEFHIHGDIKQFIEKMTPYAIVLDEMERWQIVDIPLVTTITDQEYLRKQEELIAQGKNPAIDQAEKIDSYEAVFAISPPLN